MREKKASEQEYSFYAESWEEEKARRVMKVPEDKNRYFLGMKDLNDEGEKMGEGTGTNWIFAAEAEENGLQTEPELQNAVQSPIRKNLPPRGAPCLQCPRLGAGIFQRDDGACQHTLKWLETYGRTEA